MGRLAMFLAGGATGGLLVLNQVYENEALKEQVRASLNQQRHLIETVMAYFS